MKQKQNMKFLFFLGKGYGLGWVAEELGIFGL